MEILNPMPLPIEFSLYRKCVKVGRLTNTLIIQPLPQITEEMDNGHHGQQSRP